MKDKDEESLEIKLADFGFATCCDSFTGLSGSIGTPIYTAPEIIRKNKHDSKCDIWSAGILVFKLLVGYHPF